MQTEAANKPIIIRDIESVPTWDPYTRTTLSFPALYIYMQGDKIEISYDQDWRTGGTPHSVYTRQIIRAMIDHSEGYPTEEAIRDWLDKEGYDLIRRIDAGHTVDSDGSDYVGILTEDAEDALATIQETYISPTLPYYLADIGDLVEMLEQQGMTPNEIKALDTQRLEEIALENYMILSRHVTLKEWLENHLDE